MRGMFKPDAGAASHPIARGSLLSRLWRRPVNQGSASIEGSFLILVNVHHETIEFVLPRLDDRLIWSTVIDTYFEDGWKSDGRIQHSPTYASNGRSLVVLQAKTKRRTL